MKVEKLLTKKELAYLLGTTPQTITGQISRGQEGETLPPAITLGRKYMWNQETVLQWLRDKEQERKVLYRTSEEDFKAVSKARIKRV